MPREFSEDTERRRPPEIDETHEQQEVDEISKTAEEIASEASEELEKQERIEHLTEEAIKELEELDSNAERAEKIARESVKELECMEEDLGHKIEEVREELHEEFVNDMSDKLEERSVKETSSESEENSESSESEETVASGESHIEGSDGMVYVMETGEVSESKAEVEIEESVEQSNEEGSEVKQTSEEKQEVAEQEQSVKVRNSIVRPENSESEQVEAPARKKERSTTEEHSIEETSVDEPKRDHEEKRVVKESQEIEETSSIDSKEEIREISEEKKDTEKEHLDTSNESRETSSENEREEITTESDEIVKDELTESLEVEDDLELPVELPEEIEQDIEELAEELVEDLESQEEEEQVDESRIIVDAMTGNEHIDRSLEYRPYYQEIEEGSEQNEQEKVKEKIDEMFAKLSEEEQEKFKESVRSKLKTENLDEWVKRNSSVKASPDYKEKYKDAKKYLRGKQKGKVPRLIKELWKDEVERVWTSAVGSVILRTMERLLAKAMKPKGRVVSFDIQQYLNLNKNKGHTINKEFQQFHNLTGKSRNTRYGVIDGEGIDVPKSRKVKEVSERPWRIRSKKDLEKALEHHIDLMARKDFDQRHGDAIEYCRLRNRKGIAVPDLVKELENRELKRLYETVHGSSPEFKIESMDDVDELIKKHPAESKRTDFEERRNFSELYFQIKDDHSMKRDEIAKAYEVSKGFVTKAWNDIEPAQITQLRKLEEDRIVREWDENIPIITESALKEFKGSIQFNRTRTNEFVQRIEGQVMQEVLEPLRNAKEPTKEDIISVVEQMIRNISDETQRFVHVNLDSELGIRKIKQVERCLRINRLEIEESLSKTLGLDHVRARIAVVENRMYSWIPKHRPDELVRAYEDQFYYFRDRKEVIRIIDELRRNLGVEGNLRKELPYVSEIVKQLIEYKGGDSARKKPLDIHSTRIESKIIRMYLDATGRNLSDLEGSVVKIAGISGRAGIEHPRFPEGEKLEVLVARLVATVVSDGHLWATGRISYNEAHLGRIARVQDVVSGFGVIELEPKFRKGKYDIHIPCQIGLILIEEGMTPGNKTINNPGLPTGFMGWSDTAKRAYLEDLIPEDGCFSGGRFKWSRSHAIYINKQREKYEFHSEIGFAEVELVKKRGKKLKGLIPKSILTIRQLEDLQDDQNSVIAEAAKKLVKVVNESTNNLINDETRLAESLGIMIEVYPQNVSYYPRTGRVSVSWAAATDSIDDTIRWAMECPPNDIRKKQSVERWLRKTAEKWMDKRPLRNW